MGGTILKHVGVIKEGQQDVVEVMVISLLEEEGPMELSLVIPAEAKFNHSAPS